MDGKHAPGWTALILVAAMPTGCAIGLNDSAICAGTARPSDNLQVALVADGGPLSQHAGRVLLQTLDAGCAG